MGLGFEQEGDVWCGCSGREDRCPLPDFASRDRVDTIPVCIQARIIHQALKPISATESQVQTTFKGHMLLQGGGSIEIHACGS
jgi:hypothetical protein